MFRRLPGGKAAGFRDKGDGGWIKLYLIPLGVVWGKAGKRWLNYLTQGEVEKSSLQSWHIYSLCKAAAHLTFPPPLSGLTPLQGLPTSHRPFPLSHGGDLADSPCGVCSAQGMIPGTYSSPLLTLPTPLRVGVYSHYPCSVL